MLLQCVFTLKLNKLCLILQMPLSSKSSLYQRYNVSFYKNSLIEKERLKIVNIQQFFKNHTKARIQIIVDNGEVPFPTSHFLENVHVLLA